MLRVFLDKPAAGTDRATDLGKTDPAGTDAQAGSAEGVTHEDCAHFSREFGTILDVEDVMPGSYTLEVSSPGLDRKLIKAADFTRFTGSRVKLSTRQPVGASNNRHFEGRLESFADGRLTLDLSVASHKSRKKMGAAAGEKIEIEFANVEKANLVPEI